MLRIAIALSLLSACALDLGTDEDEGEVALPPFHGRFGSPSIVRDGDALHAFFPRQRVGGKEIHVAHARSLDDGASWDFVGDAVPKLNKQAKADGSVWAPGAAKIDDDHWMVYYTAGRTGTEQKMCTYRAKSKTARGPFVDDFEGPLVCPEGTLWAIDPSPVKDAQGDWHLVMRIDEPGGNNTIKIRKLGEFGQHFAPDTDWIELAHINKGGWEEPVMENASMVRLRAGKQMRWYLFYSGGSFRNNTYAVGYADCGESIHGPCVKKTVNKPWLDSNPDLKMFGPGTPTFYRDEDGRVIMAVNTWKFPGGSENPKNGGQQTMHMFEVHVNLAGRPVARFLRMVE